jgi:Transposase IS116/IS110/IS902 family
MGIRRRARRADGTVRPATSPTTNGAGYVIDGDKPQRRTWRRTEHLVNRRGVRRAAGRPLRRGLDPARAGIPHAGQIAAIDAALRAQLEADAVLEARFAILVSIPGVGAATAFALLVEMPELGAIAPKGVASLAGLAPVARDSGRHRGQRSIRGGRAPLRQALYLPALVAVRFNAGMKARYDALRAAGKPPKVALVAIRRKLLILATALLRGRRTWTPLPA